MWTVQKFPRVKIDGLKVGFGLNQLNHKVSVTKCDTCVCKHTCLCPRNSGGKSIYVKIGVNGRIRGGYQPIWIQISENKFSYSSNNGVQNTRELLFIPDLAFEEVRDVLRPEVAFFRPHRNPE